MLCTSAVRHRFGLYRSAGSLSPASRGTACYRARIPDSHYIRLADCTSTQHCPPSSRVCSIADVGTNTADSRVWHSTPPQQRSRQLALWLLLRIPPRCQARCLVVFDRPRGVDSPYVCGPSVFRVFRPYSLAWRLWCVTSLPIRYLLAESRDRLIFRRFLSVSPASPATANTLAKALPSMKHYWKKVAKLLQHNRR